MSNNIQPLELNSTKETPDIIGDANSGELIINNTIDGNGWAGILLEDPTAVPTIKNNIISHNNDGGIRGTGKGYDHNLLFSNGNAGDCGNA